MSELIEQLAAIEHQRWADWQGYFFSKLQRTEAGDLIVPAGYVAALQKLIDTPYAELSEEQKENDRREVRRYLHLINQ
jgi:hypothetical protein